MNNKQAVILVGHGGVPTDISRDIVMEFKRLESERERQKIKAPSPREAELDRIIRTWPRTPKTDPYQQGIESLAKKLRPLLHDWDLFIAYNEFCAPSIADVMQNLAQMSYTRVRLITTMMVPGGSHAEFEIPELTADLQKIYPNMAIEYIWPYDMADVAGLLALHLSKAA